jgi:hypothetical protein
MRQQQLQPISPACSSSTFLLLRLLQSVPILLLLQLLQLLLLYLTPSLAGRCASSLCLLLLHWRSHPRCSSPL